MNQKYLNYYMQNKYDIILRIALLENVRANISDVQQVVKLGFSNNVTSEEYLIIKNINIALDYMFQTIEQPVTKHYMQNINKILVDNTFENKAIEGKFRNYDVVISGTNYTPPLLTPNEREEFLNKMFNYLENRKYDKDSTLYFYVKCMKQQLFNDGNKRTFYVLATKLLIQNNHGFLYLPSKKYQRNFMKQLRKYYEDEGFYKKLINYIKSNYLKQV